MCIRRGMRDSICAGPLQVDLSSRTLSVLRRDWLQRTPELSGRTHLTRSVYSPLLSIQCAVGMTQQQEQAGPLFAPRKDSRVTSTLK